MTSIKEAEKEDDASEAVQTIKQKCVNCLKGPNLIKTVVVMACTSIVIQQVYVCMVKLINRPITTYTHFDFNRTLVYPSVTFCREPPYKFDKMLEYGLYAHPRFTAAWLRFNFSVDLDQLWDEITYDADDFFAQYGLDGSMDNIETRPTLGFVNGRCHTIVPKVPVTHASKDTGYSITLQHSQDDVATSTSIHPPGYHVYVHYTREPYTEVQVYNGGLVDYLYVNMGETLDVKLTVDQYNMISSPDDPCSHEWEVESYSANNCTSQFVWNLVGESVGCSGPWMITSELPRCNNFTSMNSLMSTYINLYNRYNRAFCPRFCRALMYNAYVTQRQTMYTWDSVKLNWAFTTGGAALQSQIYMYFNSMMVSVYEERYNYDWNIFIADLGGSVGFLLGLSVIGLMTIVGKMWYAIVTPFFMTTKVKTDTSIADTTVTAQVEDLYQQRNNLESYNDEEYFEKCNDWRLKNLNETMIEDNKA